MATTAASRVFVDTNVLIYARLAQSPFHRLATARLLELDAAEAELFVSRQILREYLAAMTRPGTLTQPIAIEDLLADIEDFAIQFYATLANSTEGGYTRARNQRMIHSYVVGGMSWRAAPAALPRPISTCSSRCVGAA
nr:hypothetical protein [Actinomycetota bacterium]